MTTAEQQFPPHPLATVFLSLADRLTDQYDIKQQQLQQTVITMPDSTSTVAATVNDRGWLIKLWIKPGSFRLGAQALSERINEALQAVNSAYIAASTKIDNDNQQIIDAINARVDRALELIALGPAATYDMTEQQIFAMLETPSQATAPNSAAAADNDDDSGEDDRW